MILYETSWFRSQLIDLKGFMFGDISSVTNV